MPRTRSASGGGQRVILLDEIRGFAIICMVVYHAMYHLKYSFGVNVPIFFDDWFGVIRDVFAGVFIFIAGVMCRYSRNNLKRGAQCFFLGMIITFVIPFFGSHINFGILHFMGISMMIYGLIGEAFEVLPSLAGIIAAVILFVITLYVSRIFYYDVNGTPLCNADGALRYDRGFIGINGLFELKLPDVLYRYNDLSPLGFYNPYFAADDYFPLLPWFFVFIGGSYFGGWAKDGVLPKFFYESHAKWLANTGRYTIWIYMLHVPLIYLIFELIFH